MIPTKTNLAAANALIKPICIGLILLISFNSIFAQTGITWTSRTSAVNNTWRSVTYGNGLFVAVGPTGTGNRVMTSPDGITWTSRTSATDNSWFSVTYGNGLFVAVATSGTGNRVMTSPDGITWTSRTSAADNSWNSVTYGNGLFVAVATSGTGNRVMTSPDGINWTIRTSAANNTWFGVTFGNGLFVAVSSSGIGNRVMTSPDGITWTSRTSAADNTWRAVTYGNGLFVAVSGSGTGNRVMTSPDGINWTIRTSATDNLWFAITYGNGLFVAVASSGSGNRVMTSPDGITWTSRSSSADENWWGVTYSNGMFVAVPQVGGMLVMTSGTFSVLPVQLTSFTATQENGTHRLHWQTATETNNHHFDIERSTGGRSFEKIGTLAGAGNSSTGENYSFIDNRPISGTNYYRLKQTDTDGRFDYSKVISVKHTTGKRFSVYPNPVSNQLIIEGVNENNAAYIIRNGNGQTMQTGILPGNRIIETESLPKDFCITYPSTATV